MFNRMDYEVMINERKNQLRHITQHGWQFQKKPNRSVPFRLFRKQQRLETCKECYGA